MGEKEGFQIVMAQPDLGAGFQQMSGEAVAEHMGINFF
jgi:hypothetical protein